MNTLTSIILPTFNGANYIKRAIESVRSQSYNNWELLIVDDGSTDETANMVKSYLGDERIKYFKNDKNLGIQKSLNRGISLSKGELIARIDDDDEWIDNDKLEKQVEFLNLNKEYVLVGTDAIIVDTSGKEIGKYFMPKTDKQIRKRILSKNCFLHPSIMAKTDAVKKVGLYEEGSDIRHVEDYDLWLRLGTIGKMANIDRKAIAITIHPSSITAKNRVSQARKTIKLSWKFKDKYPNFFSGFLMGVLRLLFFRIASILPISGKFIYKMQVLYKGA